MTTAVSESGIGHRRHWGPWVLFGVSVLAIAVALLIGLDKFSASGVTLSLSQANAACSSAFGQVAQVTSAKASANCSAIAAEEQAHGWLLILGVTGMAAAYAWHTWLRRKDTAAKLG